MLIYLVSGWDGMIEAWPLAIVGSLSYIAGQWPVAHYLGPYLPDLSGALVSFWILFLFVKVWRPKTIRSFHRTPASAEKWVDGQLRARLSRANRQASSSNRFSGRGAFGLAPLPCTDRRGGRLDRPVVPSSANQLASMVGGGQLLGHANRFFPLSTSRR